jgi:S-adenosylmethionine/arginine decarboxylase-like enzyme
VACEHASADLEGVAPSRLGDAQALGPLLLAAANAAGMHPAGAPVVHSGPGGVTALLPCHGGHVAMHTLPDAGRCFADVLSVGGGAGRPQRGLEVIVRRLAAREAHIETRHRGSVGHPSTPGGL